MTDATGERKRWRSPRAILRGLVRIRLKHAIVLAVAWSVLAAELAVLGPSMGLWQREEMSRIERDALLLVRANVDPLAFPSVGDVVRIGQRLGTLSTVRGGAVFNANGDELAAFGARPSLGFTAARREGTTTLASADRAFLDVYYPAETTGLAHPIILRLDASGVPAALRARLVEKALVILAIGLVAGLVVAVLLGLWVVRPMLRLRQAAMAATDDPSRAEGLRLNWTRTDEVGDLARAVDMLLGAVSVIHQEDLAAGQEAVRRAAHAVIAYDPSGRMLNANPAALALFGVDSLEKLMRLPGEFVRVETVSGPVDLSPHELVARSEAPQPVLVLTPGGERRCQLSGAVIRRQNGMILRTVVTLIDVTAEWTRMRALEGERDRALGNEAQLRRRLGEMRALFDGCLTILASIGEARPQEPVAPEAGAPLVMTDWVIEAWRAEAARGGREVDVRHDELPVVKGAPGGVAAVFRHAFAAVAARSASEAPALAVSGAVGDDGMARFEVAEAEPPAGEARPRARGDALEGGAPIAVMALARALPPAGGQLVEAGGKARNAVVFTLPSPRIHAAAERARGGARQAGGARG
jgi:PAS domain-containing protein